MGERTVRKIAKLMWIADTLQKLPKQSVVENQQERQAYPNMNS